MELTLALLVNFILFRSNLQMLLFDFCVEFITLNFLLVLERLHMLLKVVTVLTDLLHFILLHSQQALRLVQLGVLIAQSIDLCLQFIWLLFLDHFLVSRRDTFDLLQARVTEAVTQEANFGK